MSEYQPDKYRSCVQVVAELGINHNGEISLAKELISACVVAGVDAAKLQLYDPQQLIGLDQKTLEYAQKAAIDPSFILELLDYVDNRIMLYCSVFDPASYRIASQLAFDDERLSMAVKIPAGVPVEIAHTPVHHNVIFSTGMMDMAQVAQAISDLRQRGWPDYAITALQCTTAYPCPPAALELRAMQAMAATWPGITFGLSDHTTMVNTGAMAVTAGARMIEKHVTLDNTADGPDHHMSLMPSDLCHFVNLVRVAELAMGNPVKQINAIEEKYLGRKQKYDEQENSGN